MKRAVILIIFTTIILFSCKAICFSQDNTQETEIAGVLFGQQVPTGNYYFAKRAVISFGAKWRGTPQDQEQLEDLTWQELLFSYEAFKQNIQARPEEIEEEIEKLLKSSKVEFDWRVDKEAYEKWAKDNLNMGLEAFRNQMEHLIKLEKLRTQTIDSFDPEVTDQEAFQKFLDEYNTLMVELKQFDDKEEAQKFYENAIVPVKKEETDTLIWNDLILSYEAAKRGIKAEEDEIDRRIKKLLRDSEIKFNWQKETEKYEQWAQDNFKVSVEDLKKLLGKVIALDKLRLKIIAKEEPEIDQAPYKEFLEKNKMLSITYSVFTQAFQENEAEVLKFSSLQGAKEFYKKIKREAGFWADQRRLDPKSFKIPGFVALDFLLNMWGFDKEAAYVMLDRQPNTYYPPAPIYKGFGVFKIMKIRKAEPEKFKEKKDYYIDRVKNIKKHEMYKQWVEDLKEKAQIERYIKK